MSHHIQHGARDAAALNALGMPILAIPAAILAAIGLYLYEYAFVMAPQEIPNS